MRVVLKPAAHYRQPWRTLVSCGHFLAQLGKKFTSDNSFMRAAGLSFSTLLAMIPLAALILSLMSGFGALDTIQQTLKTFLIQMMIPTRQEEFMRYFEQFLGNANRLGVVGLSIFGLTSILLLNSINENINAVWRSRSRASAVARFSTYVSILVVGSLLVTASFTLSADFGIPRLMDVGFVKTVVSRIAPGVFDFLLLFLLIRLIPSAPVNLSSAFLASAIGAVGWELLKYLFVNVSSWAVRTSLIYGSIAVIPIFLFWVYLTWIVILFSLDVAFIHQHRRHPWTGKPIREQKGVLQIAFALDMILVISRSFYRGEEPPSRNGLSRLFGTTPEEVDHILTLFQESGYLHQISNGGGWVPSRDLTAIKLKDLVRTVFGEMEEVEMEINQALKAVYRLHAGALDAVDTITVADVLVHEGE